MRSRPGIARWSFPFGNTLVVLDLSKGQYLTDGARRVIGLNRGQLIPDGRACSAFRAAVQPALNWGRCTGAAGKPASPWPAPQEEGIAMLFYGPQLGGWGWLPGLSFLMIWALLAVIVFAIARSFARSGHRPFGPRPGYPSPPGPYGPGPGPGPGQPTPPEHILAERFARGEIDEDEFHQRMTVLRAEAPHPPGPGGPAY